MISSSGVKPLPKNLRSVVRSGISIVNVAQCVDELVLNSIDAGATEINVFVNIDKFIVKVDDDGAGLTKEELENVGMRYHTSKCHSLQDLQSLKYYGYRGEALSSIIEVSDIVRIISHPQKNNSKNLLEKKFKKGGAKSSMACVFGTDLKTSNGVLVEVRGVLSRFPVRQKSVNKSIQIEDIKESLEHIALVNPQVTFDVRDETKKSQLLYVSATSSCLLRFAQLYSIKSKKHEEMIQADYQIGSVLCRGYLSKDLHSSKCYQFIYVNKRFLTRSKLHHKLQKKMLQEIFPAASEKYSSYPIYIILIECPLSYYDIIYEPRTSKVQFKDWEVINDALDKLIELFRKTLDANASRNHDTIHMLCAKNSTKEQLQSSSLNLPAFSTNQAKRVLQSRFVARDSFGEHKVAGSTNTSVLGSNKSDGTSVLSRSDVHSAKVNSMSESKRCNTVPKKLTSVNQNRNVVNIRSIRRKAKQNAMIAKKYFDPAINSDALLQRNVRGSVFKTFSQWKNSKNYAKAKRPASSSTSSSSPVVAKRKKRNDVTATMRTKFPTTSERIMQSFKHNESNKERKKVNSDEISVALSSQEMESWKWKIQRFMSDCKNNKNVEKVDSIEESQEPQSHELPLTSENVVLTDTSPVQSVTPFMTKESEKKDLFLITSNSERPLKDLVDAKTIENDVRIDLISELMSTQPGREFCKNLKGENCSPMPPEPATKEVKIQEVSHEGFNLGMLQALPSKTPDPHKIIESFCLEEIDEVSNSKNVCSTSFRIPPENATTSCLPEYNSLSGFMDHNYFRRSHGSKSEEFNEQFLRCRTLKSSQSEALETLNLDGNDSAPLFSLENENDKSSKEFLRGTMFEIQDATISPNLANGFPKSTESSPLKNVEKVAILDLEEDCESEYFLDDRDLRKNQNDFYSCLEKTEERLNKNNLYDDNMAEVSSQYFQSSENTKEFDGFDEEFQTISIDGESSEKYPSLTGSFRLDNNSFYNTSNNNDPIWSASKSDYAAKDVSLGLKSDKNGNDRTSLIESQTDWNELNLNITVDQDGTEWLKSEDSEGKIVYIDLGTGMISHDRKTPVEPTTGPLDPKLSYAKRNWLRRHYPKMFSKIWNNDWEGGRMRPDGNLKMLESSGNVLIKDSLQPFVSLNNDAISCKWRSNHEGFQNLKESRVTLRDSKYEKYVSRLNTMFKLSKNDVKSARVIGQLDNKFVVAVMQTFSVTRNMMHKVLVLFDQHAVHERIRLEKFISNLDEQNNDGTKKKIKSVPISPPYVLNLSDTEVRVISCYAKSIQSYGISFDVLNPRRIQVNAVPQPFYDKIRNEAANSKDATMEKLLYKLVQEEVRELILKKGASTSIPKSIFNLLCSRACHGAIKFGDPLEISECETLVCDLVNCKTPFQCAHGRPSIVPLSFSSKDGKDVFFEMKDDDDEELKVSEYF